MIFATDIYNIDISKIIFCNQIRNNVISGVFSKINYNTEFSLLNGLYILFPIEPTTHQHNTIEFNPYTEYNFKIIKILYNIENHILNKYNRTNSTIELTKKKLILSSQLHTGFMKIYKDNSNSNSNITNNNNNKLVIKISGIWDTQELCGITYKLYEGSHIT